MSGCTACATDTDAAAERVASTGKIEIDLQAGLLALEACIADEYGRVTLGLMERLRDALLAAHPM